MQFLQLALIGLKMLKFLVQLEGRVSNFLHSQPLALVRHRTVRVSN